MGDIDFVQPRALWEKVFKEENREYLVKSMAGSIKPCKVDIKERMIKLCTKVHPDFGKRLAQGLDMQQEPAKLWSLREAMIYYNKIYIKQYSFS